MKRWIALFFGLLFAADAALGAGAWSGSESTLRPGKQASFVWGASDAGDAQPAIDVSQCATLEFSAYVSSGTPSVPFYLRIAASDTPATGGTPVFTAVGTQQFPVRVDIGANQVLDPDIDTAGAAGGFVFVRCGGLAVRGAAPGALPVANSFAGMKACLESPITTDCAVNGDIVLPAGHNVIRWRTRNFLLGAPTTGISGLDRKMLWCFGGGWQGTSDAVTDTATLTFDFSDIDHDAELGVTGCSINGTTDTAEPVLRLEHATGISGGNLIRLWFQRNHWNQLVANVGPTIATTATFSFAGMWFTSSHIDLSTVGVGPFISHLGGHGGSVGQGGRVYFSDDLVVGNSSVALWESVGSVGNANIPLIVELSNVNLTSGGFGQNAGSTLVAPFQFGAADATILKFSNVNWFCNSSLQAVTALALYQFTGAATLATRTALVGDISFFGSNNNCGIGALYGIQSVAGSAARGPQVVNLRFSALGSSTYPFRSIAFAGTNATLGLRELNLSVVGRQNLPSGSDTPSFFDRTFTDKLISEATANGVLSLNGKPISVVNGMIGSGSFPGFGLFARTLNVPALNSDTTLLTQPANTPATYTRAACWTEDTTGSAVFTIWKNTFAGNPMFAAPAACGYRKTDAAATTCPTCTGGVAQTATLSVAPDDKSIICSSTTPATSFQIAPDGAGYNFVNITAASKTPDATTISWTPTATVTANLTCTYDTKPAWQTLGNGNNTVTGGEVIGVRAGAGFGGIGKTRIFIEATPAF